MARLTGTLVILALTSLMIAGCQTEGDTHAETDAVEHDAEHTHDGQNEESPTQSVAGVISGFDCAVVGELCPTTHVGADYTAGIVTDDMSFVFVVNIPQSFLQQYFREEVEVEGTVYDPYNRTIEPEAIHVNDANGQRLVYEAGYFIDEHGGRATFQDGVFENGRWVAPS